MPGLCRSSGNTAPAPARSRTLTGSDVLYSSLWDWKWHLIKALPGWQGGCRTSPSPAVLPVCSLEHLLPGLPLMPPMAGRGGGSSDRPCRYANRPGEVGIAEVCADPPYVDGERTRAGMPPDPVKDPEPQSCSLWSGKRDSNPRPSPWEGGALPSELLPHIAVSPAVTACVVALCGFVRNVHAYPCQCRRSVCTAFQGLAPCCNVLEGQAGLEPATVEFRPVLPSLPPHALAIRPHLGPTELLSRIFLPNPPGFAMIKGNIPSKGADPPCADFCYRSS